MRIVLYGVLVMITCACSTVSAGNFSKSSGFSKKFSKVELQEFARASCISQYFKKHDYNTKVTRSVSSQIVQMGGYAAVRYRDITELVKNYKPEFPTLHDLDIDLFKCFIMMSDKSFTDKLNEIKTKKYTISDH